MHTYIHRYGRILWLLDQIGRVGRFCEKNLTPTLNSPKIAVSVIAFRIDLTPDVKIVFFVVRWMFASRNGIKIKFDGVVHSKSCTLTVYRLSCWLLHQYWNHIVCPLMTQSQIMTVSSKIFFFILMPLLFYTFFHKVEKFMRKHKIFVKVKQYNKLT